MAYGESPIANMSSIGVTTSSGLPMPIRGRPSSMNTGVPSGWWNAERNTTQTCYLAALVPEWQQGMLPRAGMMEYVMQKPNAVDFLYFLGILAARLHIPLSYQGFQAPRFRSLGRIRSMYVGMYVCV